MRTTAKYTHLELGEDVECLAGHYTPLKEVRLKYNDREVLYVVGSAVIDSSCCGTGTWGYVTVPGYLLNWQTGTNEAGLPESEVELIKDEKERHNIESIIQAEEGILQIAFW